MCFLFGHVVSAIIAHRHGLTGGWSTGVYRTGPRPIRAARKYGLNGGRPAAARGSRSAVRMAGGARLTRRQATWGGPYI